MSNAKYRRPVESAEPVDWQAKAKVLAVLLKQAEFERDNALEACETYREIIAALEWAWKDRKP